MRRMKGNIRWWHDRTSEEIASLSRGPLVALLPLAAIEQHGPHLPLSTDLDINMGLLGAAFSRLPPDTPVVALPPLAITDSSEHETFAGTLNLEPGTLIRTLFETGRSLARAGVRRLILFNSHGGNSECAAIAALDLRREQGMLVVQADYFRFPAPTGPLPAEEIGHDIHGGALETAMMLALRPEAVRREAIPAGRRGRAPVVGTQAQAPYAWLAGDLDENGVIGNPSLATAEQGRQLIDHYAGALKEIIEATAAFDLDRLKG